MIYLICSLARTGSSLLCDLIAQTGLASTPTEWGNKNILAQSGIGESGCEPLTKEYINVMVEKYATDGIWGMKFPVHSYAGIIKACKVESFFPERPRYLYLTRNDKLGQSVSMVKAGETGQYYADQKFDTLTRQSCPEYSRWKITYFLRAIDEYEETWEGYFRAMGIEPLRVNYEELIADNQATIEKIFTFLGVAIPDGFVCSASTMKKQADHVNRQWMEVYLEGR